MQKCLHNPHVCGQQRARVYTQKQGLLQVTPEHRRKGIVVRASASLSVDLRFIPKVESYHKTLRNGIHSFPAWLSAHRDSVKNKLACCVLGSIFM